jgi:hypothetical protein
MTRRASQCRVKIAALAVLAFRVVVTISLDRVFDSVRKKGTHRRWRTGIHRTYVNSLWTVALGRYVSHDNSRTNTEG